MAEITTHKTLCSTCEINNLRAGSPEDTTVVLLHGMKFQAATWHEIGTLERIANAGFQAIAMDMPGFGLSPACSEKQDSVLEKFLQMTRQQNVILLGPSMGGRIALEFTIDHPDLVAALVLVGAVGVEENKAKLHSINIPTLAVWGSEDRISPLTNCELIGSTVPGSKKIIIEGAPHPCYLDKPDKWHEALTSFLNSLKS